MKDLSNIDKILEEHTSTVGRDDTGYIKIEVEDNNNDKNIERIPKGKYRLTKIIETQLKENVEITDIYEPVLCVLSFLYENTLRNKRKYMDTGEYITSFIKISDISEQIHLVYSIISGIIVILSKYGYIQILDLKDTKTLEKSRYKLDKEKVVCQFERYYEEIYERGIKYCNSLKKMYERRLEGVESTAIVFERIKKEMVDDC